MDATIFNDLSEQTARGDYRVVGVSRGHSSQSFGGMKARTVPPVEWQG